MKRRIFALLILTLLTTTSSCVVSNQQPDMPPPQAGNQSQPLDVPSEPGRITFTDDLGQEFTLEKPERVVAMIGSFADIWLLAGGEDSLVATANDAWESYELELGENVANIGSGMKPNGELVLAAEPDLVIASSLSPSNLELRETFERAGIPTAYFDVGSFQDYLDLLELCTQLTGNPENFETYGTAVKEQVDAAMSKVDGSAPTVLNLQVSGSSIKVKNSEDNVLGEMLAALGCVNIADRDGSLLEDLSLEAIIQADPDFIFAVYHGTDEEGAEANLEAALLSNPAWANLRAVQKGRFLVMDRHMYNLKPNALWGDAYERLARVLYEGDKEYVLNGI